jgi:hypothetical protein
MGMFRLKFRHSPNLEGNPSFDVTAMADDSSSAKSSGQVQQPIPVDQLIAKLRDPVGATNSEIAPVLDLLKEGADCVLPVITSYERLRSAQFI